MATKVKSKLRGGKSKSRQPARIKAVKPTPLVITKSYESDLLELEFDDTSTSTSTYSPDWTKELKLHPAYIAKGGAGYKFCHEHDKRLTAALDKKTGSNLERRHQLLTSVSADNQNDLNYLNPFSKLVWLGAALQGFVKWEPASPLYAVTLIHEGWDRSTADTGNGYGEVKAKVEALMDEVEVSVFGHVEYAVFPKQKIDDGYRAAAHAQCLLWDADLKKLKRVLKAHFPKRDDGVLGYMVKELKKDFHRALSYATKPPAYGYSGWPTETGGARHRTVELPQECHRQLLRQFDGLTWPEACIAAGEGRKIKRTAIKGLGFSSEANKSPLADEPVDGVAGGDTGKSGVKVVALKLTPAGTLHPAMTDALSLDRPALQVQAETATAEFAKYLSHEQKGNDVLHKALEPAYEMAINAYGSPDALQAMAEAQGVTFNQGSDLHHLAMKIIAKKLENERNLKVDKRRVSECAAALRYLYSTGCNSQEVSAKLKLYGGTRKCAKALGESQSSKEKSAKSPPILKVWRTFKKHGSGGFTVRANDIAMPFPRGLLFAARNKERNTLYVRHVLNITDALAESFVRKIANDLTPKPKKAVA